MQISTLANYFKPNSIKQMIRSVSAEFFLNSSRSSDGIDPHIVSFVDPDSYVSEQYKVLCTKIFGKNGEKVAPRSIVITSAQPGDGKTVTACNIAATLVKNFKQRVLLIDADLRRPAIHSYFGIPRSPGLTDILKGTIGYQQFVEEPAIRNLNIIPAGTETSNPGGLLSSIGLKVLLSRISNKFDTVIFDTSPVLKTADAQIIGAYSDSVYFVVKAGVTPRHMVEEAFALLKDTPGAPAGCIMTNNQRIPDYYSYWTNPHYRHYYRYRSLDKVA